MENNDIIVFVGLDALQFGALIGIGAISGVWLAFLALGVLEKVLRFVARKGGE